MFSQLNSRKELEIPFYIFYLQINLRLQIHVFRVVSFFKTKTLTLRKMHLGAVEILDFFSARGPYQGIYFVVPYRQATQKAAKATNGGPQQVGTTKPEGAATRAADFTAVPSLPPIDIGNLRYSCCC